MKDNNYLNKSREYLSNGKVQDCIDQLKGNIKDEDLLNQILQLEIRHGSLRRKINKGIIDINDSQLEENRISNALLLIISNLAKGNHGFVPTPTPKQSVDFKWIIIGILALSLLGMGGYLFSSQMRSAPDNPVKDLCEGINCQNGGTCKDGTCKCPDGYSGKYCQIVDNNTTPSPQSVAKPDLKITAFQMKPELPVQKEKVSMQAIIKNIGNGNAGSFKVKWWAGENFPEPAFQKTFNGLGPGAQKVFSFQYDGYASNYGKITSKLEIDADNLIKESNEENNVLRKSYAVKRNVSNDAVAKPDLKITAFQMSPELPIQKEKVYMQAIVKNLGNGNAGKFKIKWWAGENFPEPAFQKTFNGLGPGAQKVFSFQYNGYTSNYGRITSKLEIDADNLIKESNEENNVLRKSYAVKRKN